MVTAVRSGGLRIVIYANDHEPAHVHVFGDGEAKINLVGADGGAELVWAVGMSCADVRRAMKLIVKTRDALLAKWEEIHG